MKQIICSNFSHGILLVPKISKYPVSITSARKLMSGKFSRHCKPLLASPQLRYFANPHRGYAMLVARVLRGALKIRYLFLGGAVGGGLTLQKKYEQWKEIIPDVEWIRNLLPNEQQWQDFRGSLVSIKNNVADKIEIGEHITNV